MTIMRKKTIDTIPALTEEIKNTLISFSRSRILPASLINRVNIALLAGEGLTNQEISARLNMHYNSVGTWRSRFLDALPHLREIQESAPDKLSDEIRKVFSDKPRPGCPCVFTQEQIMKIIDLACKAPSDFGYEVSQWSLNLLVKEIRKQGIAEDISAKSVSRFLKGGQAKTP